MGNLTFIHPPIYHRNIWSDHYKKDILKVYFIVPSNSLQKRERVLSLVSIQGPHLIYCSTLQIELVIVHLKLHSLYQSPSGPSVVSFWPQDADEWIFLAGLSPAVTGKR